MLSRTTKPRVSDGDEEESWVKGGDEVAIHNAFKRKK